jgi:ATP-dependent helicase HrpA
MLNPAKYAEKAAQLAVHQERLKHFRKQESLSPEQLQMVREFALMIEEFKVSLFAQELKTSFPISAKRLDKMWAETRKAFDNF